MSIRTALVLLALGTAIAATPRAQARADARDWPAWLDAVTTHRPGDRDAAVARVSQWTRDDLDRVQPMVSQLEADERSRVVSRALVLHTDVAIFGRTSTGYDLPAGDQVIFLFADGKDAGQMVRTFHWDFGRRLVARLQSGEDRTRIGRVYYRAAGAVLQLWAEDGELQAHFAAGRRLLGDDPVLLMYEGTMHQADADARSQRYFDQIRQARRDPSARGATAPIPTAGGAAMQPRANVLVLPPTTERARAEAERYFRRALEADPSFAEARVRLAHILHDRGRHTDAARQLDGATIPGSATPFLRYYSSMLAGRVARALDRIDAAQAAFEAAVAVEPRAQSPRLALSELAMARGDALTAQRYLAPLSAAAGPDDPWWRVGRTHGASAQGLSVGMWKDLQE
jgi:tetratricopeptide (TPR) repeat protein